MTPGSLLLGRPGQFFECKHEHGAGDRCLSFGFSPEYFERIAADAGRSVPDFNVLHIPPLRELSSLIARATVALTAPQPQTDSPWQELGLELAALVFQLMDGRPRDRREIAPSTLARVTRSARMIERNRDTRYTLEALAREARLSPCHFLRAFRQATGVTPHQYVRRARLREAAVRLRSEAAPVLDVALDSGFGDVSNFNHAFRAEFGMSPREFRRFRRSDAFANVAPGCQQADDTAVSQSM
jgi:AraC-like DNA-binding protein